MLFILIMKKFVKNVDYSSTAAAAATTTTTLLIQKITSDCSYG
jgi:hypothetical protein